MVVQCPQCGTGHLLDDEDFSGRSHLQAQCSKCFTQFTVRSPEETPAQASKPPMDVECTGNTTVVAIRTKLPTVKKVALLMMQGPMKGTVFYITKPEVTIGRAGADIVVDDPEVSSNHCSLEIRGSTAVLTDLGSTNGTYVGEEQIKSCRLEHLSEFRIGTTTMMFSISDIE